MVPAERLIGANLQTLGYSTEMQEAMLAANQAVAEQLAADALPAPYRNHEPPSHADTLLLVEHRVHRRA